MELFELIKTKDTRSSNSSSSELVNLILCLKQILPEIHALRSLKRGKKRSRRKAMEQIWEDEEVEGATEKEIENEKRTEKKKKKQKKFTTAQLAEETKWNEEKKDISLIPVTNRIQLKLMRFEETKNRNLDKICHLQSLLKEKKNEEQGIRVLRKGGEEGASRVSVV
eukprot:MONOS_6896.1-p1 / transcript=MONOS_6896.1 / gene=MONOS_6896 / organism=Monocercomonoides_exilis_PA203 / gene_product=unspecified product / transcript_product=unspecified product / location=Mono_scaffold00226:25180-25680(+) / protein_length=167 / sequence_SO=supercontig / SO=protein_coding / is_pseudo=false